MYLKNETNAPQIKERNVSFFKTNNSCNGMKIILQHQHLRNNNVLKKTP